MDEEEFEFDNQSPDTIENVARFEEMLRNNATYFFDASAFEHIIHFFLDKNDPVKALQVCEYAVEQYPFEVDFHIKQAQIYSVTNQVQSAMAALDKASVLEMNNADIWFVRGNLFDKIEKHTEAIECYENALKHAGDDTEEILLQIALAHINNSDYPNAMQNLKACLEVNPQNWDALFELAFCYDVTDRTEEALVYFNECIDADAYAYMAWFHLGNFYEKQELYEKAIDAYDYSLAIQEDFVPSIYQRANTLANLERYAEAAEDFKQILDFEPLDALVLCNLGECYEKLEQYATAREYYKKATKINPEMADGWFGMGITLDYEGRTFEAIHFYEKAIALNPTGEGVAEYYSAIADAFATQGKIPLAITNYEKAIELDPEDWEISLCYAMLMFDQGQNATAIEIITEAIKHNPEVPELHYRLVALFIATGQFPEALVVLESVLDKFPKEYTMLFEYLPTVQNVEALSEIINGILNKEKRI